MEETEGRRPEKVGAGFFFTTGQQVLLLKRSPKSGNPNTWGLPGGNADPGDRNALATAVRETTEEMGQPPEFAVKGEILTRRGAGREKHYTVFVAAVSEGARLEYVPRLNKEHTGFEWFQLSDLPHLPDLHPVVKKLVKECGAELNRALALVRGS
eukprot:evm.model.scf_1992.1 EVM.evm.TU.scf_1992.1   scf_1992:1184-1648(+)